MQHIFKKKLIYSIALLTLCISLSGCGQETVNYADCPDQYVKTMEYHDGFVIAQLTDIHWNTATAIGDDEKGSKAYLLSVIDEIKAKFGQIDLIEVTGDTFCLSDTRAVGTFIDTMEEIGIPYAITWGNHDQHSKFGANWLSQQFLEAPFSLYTEVDNDNLHGRCNYLVELTKDGETAWQIFCLDSGSCYRDGAFDMSLDYDCIRQDQIEWFEFMHNRAGNDVPVMCYFHIPQREFDEAYEAIMAGEPGYKSKFYMLEAVNSSPYVDNSPDAVSLNTAFARNNVRGAFVGHDHANDWTFTNPDGITYGFGVKTNRELYKARVSEDHPNSDEFQGINGQLDTEFDLTGASVVRLLNDEGDFELYHLYMDDNADGTQSAANWEEY